MAKIPKLPYANGLNLSFLTNDHMDKSEGVMVNFLTIDHGAWGKFQGVMVMVSAKHHPHPQ